MTEPTTIHAALAAAQSEFATVTKNKTNPAYKSRYADLQSIIEAVRPALNKHGLFLTQNVTNENGMLTVETVLVHTSGESISSGALVVEIAGGNGPKGVQALGSAMTYARRYSLSAFLGVTAEDDDDGNAAVEEAARKQDARSEPEFVLTQDMVDEAQNVAAGGVEAYKAYYVKKPHAFKIAMKKSGWHSYCYAIATEADKPEENMSDEDMSDAEEASMH